MKSKEVNFFSNKLDDWREYERLESKKRLKEVFKQMLLYLPSSYLEMILLLLVVVLSLPVVLSRGMYHWLKASLSREIAIEDFASIKDKDQAELIRKTQIKAIKSSVTFFEKTMAFILGIIVTLIGLMFTDLLSL